MLNVIEIARPSYLGMGAQLFEVLHTPFSDEKSALVTGRKIEWTLVDCPPALADYRLAPLLAVGSDLSDEEDAAYEDIHNELAGRRGDFDVMLRGNADFAQEDVRYYEDLRGMENLIGFSSYGSAFMWGDVGEATFLIDPVDLRARDLSNVYYSWDCC